MTREKFRILAAAALFLLMTGMRLLLPRQTAVARRQVQAAVSGNWDYESAFRALGERLSGGTDGGGDAPRAVSAPQAAEDFGLPTAESLLRRWQMTGAEEPREVFAETGEADAPETSAAAESTPAAVAAFLESQAAFSDYAVPANVTYDFPSLPFAYQSPVTGTASSGFGYRLHPIQNVVKFHYGTDFAAWPGTDVPAVADGPVAMVGWDDGYGNYAVLSHGEGWQTLYAHCSRIFVACGQSVRMGDRIALVGATGEVTGPHLHFELTCDGVYYNPEFWLA